jgi:hypothetical protein
MGRWLDRAGAALIVGVSLLAFHNAYLAATVEEPSVGSMLRMVLFPLGAIACLFAASRLWARPSTEAGDPPDARRFGRTAVKQAPAPSRLLRPVAFGLAAVLAAALALDGPRRSFGDRELVLIEDGEEQPAPMTELQLPNPSPPAGMESASPPLPAVPTEPDVPPPLPAVPTEPPETRTDQRQAAAPERQDGQESEAPAEQQQMAAVPAEPGRPSGEASPPETVAPVPPPVAVPSQPDGHRDSIVFLALSPDGSSVASASIDRSIKLWDARDLSFIRDLGEQGDMARSAIFMPDGERLLTAGDDGVIMVRSVADGRVLHVLSTKDHGGVREVSLSMDGRRALSAHEAGTVIIWDMETLKPLHVMRGHAWPASGAALSPDGTRGVSGSIDGELILWDARTGVLIRRWAGHERGSYGIAFTPDGRRFVTGSSDRTIKVWDSETGVEIRRLEGHSAIVYSIAISEDGKQILSGSVDGTVRLWNIESGRELKQFHGHAGPVYAAVFGPDETILSGSKDRTIRRWQADGRQVALALGAPD